MFPKFVMIKQNCYTEKLEDISMEVTSEVSKISCELPKLKGKKVGIAVGSRGISNIDIVVKTLVEIVKRHEGQPFVLAAMGSHGGTAENGQKEILASLGITQETVGAEICSSTKSRLCGRTKSGLNVYINELAFEFDELIVVNRIKPHTDFEDNTESGLFKLLAIGIGNHEGAKNIHAAALRMGYGPAIREAAELMIKKLPIAFGVAVTENWKHEINGIKAVRPKDFYKTETMLLKQVKDNAMKIPIDNFDTLIVKAAGKNISGTCVDTKVVGRIMIPGQKEPETPNIKTIAVLNFTEESHGNAMGLGVVDIITQKAFDAIDIKATGLTGMTSTCLLQSKIPCVAPNDYDAIEVAFTSTGLENHENIKAVYINNTNSLEYMAVSAKVYDEIKSHENIEKIGDFFELLFDKEGSLLNDIPID